jgi:hypothetical protein
MQKVSSKSRSDGDGYIECQDSDIEENTGWEDEISNFGKSKVNIIKIANDKFPLSHLVASLKFEEKYSPSGWTHKSSCPFPDHNDSSPSFYYNPKEDRFNCFGCSRFGKSVEYLSYFRKISKTAAAQLILKKFGQNYNLNEVKPLQVDGDDTIADPNYSYRGGGSIIRNLENG